MKGDFTRSTFKQEKHYSIPPSAAADSQHRPEQGDRITCSFGNFSRIWADCSCAQTQAATPGKPSGEKEAGENLPVAA